MVTTTIASENKKWKKKKRKTHENIKTLTNSNRILYIFIVINSHCMQILEN